MYQDQCVCVCVQTQLQKHLFKGLSDTDHMQSGFMELMLYAVL